MSEKKSAILFILISSFLFLPFVYAESDNSMNLSKIDDGTNCLNGIADDCSSLSVKETALVLLAAPAQNVSDKCEEKLQAQEIAGENCFGSGSCDIIDTSLAILALNSVGVETQKYEEWLLNNTAISTDLIWILQIDSDVATKCKIFYDGQIYDFNIREDKKIEGDAGSCFTRTQSDFWLQISPECYSKSFSASCDTNFKGSLLYKSRSSNVLNILSGTKEVASGGSYGFTINTKCFSLYGDCNYEENVWAALALSRNNEDIIQFTPYLIASAESNKQYLPNAFLYMIRALQTDADALILEQQPGSYWKAENSVYNEFYDTALALLSLGESSATQVSDAKRMLLSPFRQDTSGCWNSNSLTDTAMILWALKGWTYSSGGPGIPDTGITSTTRCAEANFTCTIREDCISGDRLLNYFCPGNAVCCKTIPEKKRCAEMSGTVCGVDETCSGTEKEALDEKFCCLGTCEKRTSDETECESQGSDYVCSASCNANFESADSFSCNNGDVCCKKKTATKTSNLNWLWITLLILAIILIILAIIFRNQIKLWIFKNKSKFKKEDKGRPSSPFSPTGGLPPRPGFPPIRRPMGASSSPMFLRQPMPSSASRPSMPSRPMPSRTMPPSRTSSPPAKKDKIDEVFKKLKDMSK